MVYHIPLEETITAGFIVWLMVSLLWNVGSWLRGLAWAGLVVLYHHLYFRIWAWRMRPKREG